MKVRNPTYTVDGRIDCEIDHPNHGWIPYTAGSGTSDVFEKAVYEAALKAKPAAYVASPPPTAESLRPAMQITRRQVFIGMEKSGIITASEAIAVATVGTVPAAIKAAIETLPQDDQTPAFITFGLFQTAYRLDPMVALFQATAGMDDDAMDAFFITYAAI